MKKAFILASALLFSQYSLAGTTNQMIDQIKNGFHRMQLASDHRANSPILNYAGQDFKQQIANASDIAYPKQDVVVG